MALGLKLYRHLEAGVYIGIPKKSFRHLCQSLGEKTGSHNVLKYILDNGTDDVFIKKSISQRTLEIMGLLYLDLSENFQ